MFINFGKIFEIFRKFEIEISQKSSEYLHHVRSRSLPNLCHSGSDQNRPPPTPWLRLRTPEWKSFIYFFRRSIRMSGYSDFRGHITGGGHPEAHEGSGGHKTPPKLAKTKLWTPNNFQKVPLKSLFKWKAKKLVILWDIRDLMTPPLTNGPLRVREGAPHPRCPSCGCKMAKFCRFAPSMFWTLIILLLQNSNFMRISGICLDIRKFLHPQWLEKCTSLPPITFTMSVPGT